MTSAHPIPGLVSRKDSWRETSAKSFSSPHSLLTVSSVALLHRITADVSFARVVPYTQLPVAPAFEKGSRDFYLLVSTKLRLNGLPLRVYDMVYLGRCAFSSVSVLNAAVRQRQNFFSKIFT